MKNDKLELDQFLTVRLAVAEALCGSADDRFRRGDIEPKDLLAAEELMKSGVIDIEGVLNGNATD